jgi:hypothetical protein
MFVYLFVCMNVQMYILYVNMHNSRMIGYLDNYLYFLYSQENKKMGL